MTDGNTYAINKHLDESEDYDALQEVTAELEQAEARIEELEDTLSLRTNLHQECIHLLQSAEAKLAAALEMAIDECGYYWGSESYNNWWQERRNRVAQLKGEK